jgi:lipoate-protein ligase A
MAVDEAVLRAGRENGNIPAVRFYGWSRPSVTIGCFQKISEEVNIPYCREHGIDIVRRPTGGRAVYHDIDVTYSVVARESDKGFSPQIIDTYRVISNCLLRGLKKVGIEAKLVEQGRNLQQASGKAFCFSASFKNELLVKGCKVCGSAQMRAHGLFLQHGSILLDLNQQKAARIMVESETVLESIQQSVTDINSHTEHPVSVAALVDALAEGFEETMGIRFRESEISVSEADLKKLLLEKKYLTEKWNIEGKHEFQKSCPA